MSQISEDFDSQIPCEVCRQPSRRKCSACKLAHYCSIEHLKDNWRIHKDHCIPYEISRSSELGKFVKIIKDLPRNEVIFNDEPLIFGPKRCLTTPDYICCIGCCQPLFKEKCQKCPECKWPICQTYCPKLQMPAGHSLECDILKTRPYDDSLNFHQNYRFDIILVLRALVLRLNHRNHWNTFLKFDDFSDRRGPGTEAHRMTEEKYSYILKYYPQFSDVSSDIFHKVCGILDINALPFEHCDVVYPIASLIGHDCTPNAMYHMENFILEVRSALPLKKGAVLRFCHTNILWGTQERRRHLSKYRYLSCKCDRCKDPTEFKSYLSALRCAGDGSKYCGGIQLPPKPTEEKIRWICNKCKIRLPNDDVMRFVNHLGLEVGKMLNRKPHKIKDLEEILGKLLHFFHSNHHHVFAVKFAIIETDGCDSDTEKRIKMCTDLIGIIRKIDPGNAVLSDKLAFLLGRLFKGKLSQMSKENRKPNEDEVTELRKILEENKLIVKEKKLLQNDSSLIRVICDNEKNLENFLKSQYYPN